jgi:hypothetical protein
MPISYLLFPFIKGRIPITPEVTAKGRIDGSENEALVVFTIPSGEENEFTSNDTSVTLSTKNQTINTKDELGLVDLAGGAAMPEEGGI